MVRYSNGGLKIRLKKPVYGPKCPVFGSPLYILNCISPCQSLLIHLPFHGHPFIGTSLFFLFLLSFLFRIGFWATSEMVHIEVSDLEISLQSLSEKWGFGFQWLRGQPGWDSPVLFLLVTLKKWMSKQFFEKTLMGEPFFCVLDEGSKTKVVSIGLF